MLSPRPRWARYLSVCVLAFFFSGSASGAVEQLGSAIISRPITDLAAHQVYIYDGASFSAGQKMDTVSWYHSRPAGRDMTPILFERDAQSRFIIRGVGTSRKAVTGFNSAAFALQYGTDVTTNGNFTWGFINAGIDAQGNWYSATTGAVDFNSNWTAQGAGGAGTTSKWRFTPSSFQWAASLSPGKTFGAAADYHLETNEFRAYSAILTSSPAVTTLTTTRRNVNLWARAGQASPFQIPVGTNAASAVTATPNQPWISATPGVVNGANGALVTGSAQSLNAGTFSGSVTFTAPNMTSAFARVNLSVANPATATIIFGQQFAVPNPMAMGDFDGDGDIDAIDETELGGATTVTTYINTGGAFSAGGAYVANGVVTARAAGRSSQNAFSELALTGTGPSGDWVALLDAHTGVFVAAAGTLDNGAQPNGIAADDFNNDGLLDVLTSNYGTNNVTLLRRAAPGGALSVRTNIALATHPVAIAAGDFNGDGRADFSAGLSDGTIVVMLGNGAGQFAAASASPLAAIGSVRALAADDFNGDGRDDLAAATGNAARLFLGHSTNGVSAGGMITVIEPDLLAIGDMDGDGRPDLATGSTSSHQLRVLLGDGNGGFTKSVAASQDTVTARSLFARDFNGDGLADLVVADASNGLLFPGDVKQEESSMLLTRTQGQITTDDQVVVSLNMTRTGYLQSSGTVHVFCRLHAAETATVPVTGPAPIALTFGPLAAGLHGFVANYSPSDSVLDRATGGDSGDFTVINTAPVPATVSLAGLSQTYDGTPRSVEYTTSPANLATAITYNGSAAAPTAVGSYTVVATITDPNYTGSATGTLFVNHATASVTLSGLAQTYNGSPLAVTFTTSPANLAATITYDGGNAAPTAAGSYSVVATIDDLNYIGSATGTLVIGPGSATITLGGLTPTYDGTPRAATVTTSPENLSTIVTYDGSSTAPTAVGTYAVVATITDPNYAGSVTGTLVISKGLATIALDGLSQTYDATARAVTFTTVPANLAATVTYDGNSTAPSAAGSYAVVATIDDAGYTGTVSGALVIGKAGATISLSGLSQAFDGSPKVVTSETSPAGLPVSITYAGSPDAPSAVGYYAIVATIMDPNYTGTATATLSLSGGIATVSITNLAQLYDGTPKAVSATTSPSGMNVSFTYDGGATPPTAAGSYIVAATVNDPLYSGSSTDTLVISPASTTTSLSRNGTPIIGTASVPYGAFNLGVTVSSPTAGGTATLSEAGVVIGTGTVSGGEASFALSPALGSHSYVVDYSGDSNHTSSTVSATLQVVPAPVTVTISNVLQPWALGAQQQVDVATDPAGVVITVSYNGKGALPKAAGTYEVVATVTDPSYIGTATATFVISKIDVAVSMSPTTAVYDGKPQTVAITTVPAGIDMDVLYDGQATAPTDGGSYTVTATNPNVNGVFSGTLLITSQPALISFDSLTGTADAARTPMAVTATTSPKRLAYSVTYNGSTSAPGLPGTYAVVATITDPRYAGQVTGTYVLEETTNITLAMSSMSVAFDGSPKTLLVSVAPSAVSGIVGIDYTYTIGKVTSSTAPSAAGVYTVTATARAPYTGSVTATMTIGYSLTLTLSGPGTLSLDGAVLASGAASIVTPGSHEVSVDVGVQTGTHRMFFKRWSDSGARTHTVNVTAPTSLTAFTTNQSLVTVSRQAILSATDTKQNTGGTAVTMLADGYFDDTGNFTVLTAPSSGYLIKSATIDGVPVAIHNPYNQTIGGPVGGAAHSVAVTFVRIAAVTSSVYPDNSGSTYTQQADGSTRPFAIGDLITVFATPRAGFILYNWWVSGGTLVSTNYLQTSANVRITDYKVAINPEFLFMAPQLQTQLVSLSGGSRFSPTTFTMQLRIYNTGRTATGGQIISLRENTSGSPSAIFPTTYLPTLNPGQSAIVTVTFSWNGTAKSAEIIATIPVAGGLQYTDRFTIRR